MYVFLLRTTGSLSMRQWQWRVWCRLFPIWLCGLEKRMLIPEPWSVPSIISVPKRLCIQTSSKYIYFICEWTSLTCICLPLCSSVLSFIQSRPFGVALLFGGVDEKGPQLLVKIWHFKQMHFHLKDHLSGVYCCLFVNAGTTWTHQAPLYSVLLGPLAQHLKEHRALFKRSTTRYRPRRIYV